MFNIRHFIYAVLIVIFSSQSGFAINFKVERCAGLLRLAKKQDININFNLEEAILEFQKFSTGYLPPPKAAQVADEVVTSDKSGFKEQIVTSNQVDFLLASFVSQKRGIEQLGFAVRGVEKIREINKKFKEIMAETRKAKGNDFAYVVSGIYSRVPSIFFAGVGYYLGWGLLDPHMAAILPMSYLLFEAYQTRIVFHNIDPLRQDPSSFVEPVLSKKRAWFFQSVMAPVTIKYWSEVQKDPNNLEAQKSHLRNSLKYAAAEYPKYRRRSDFGDHFYLTTVNQLIYWDRLTNEPVYAVIVQGQ